MDFEFSDKVKQLQERVGSFIYEHVVPAEKVYAQQTEDGGRWCVPQVMEAPSFTAPPFTVSFFVATLTATVPLAVTF